MLIDKVKEILEKNQVKVAESNLGIALGICQLIPQSPDNPDGYEPSKKETDAISYTCGVIDGSKKRDAECRKRIGRIYRKIDGLVKWTEKHYSPDRKLGTPT